MSKKPSDGPVTIEQVAAVAGVARSTVSRVVNGSSAVSPEAVAAVKRAISKLNYVPNRAARSLASRQTHAIALVVPEDTTRFFGDPFFAAIVSGINSRISRSDYVLNLIIASNDPGDKTSSFVRGGSVDGAIIVSHHTSDRYIDAIADALPVVYGGRPIAIREGSFYVDVDNGGGGYRATKYLIDKGHTRIATITGPLTMPAAIDRLDGFRRALADHGLDEFAVEDGEFRAEGGGVAMAAILATAGTPDAVFVASDLMASGAIAALGRAGLRVPDDVAVIGFDDSPVATTVNPTLTTMRQPCFEQGEMMAQVLLDLLSGKTPNPVTMFDLELIARESA